MSDDLLAHVVRAGDHAVGAVGDPALDPVDVGLRVLVDPALVAAVLGRVDRRHQRRAEAPGEVVAGRRDEPVVAVDEVEVVAIAELDAGGEHVGVHPLDPGDELAEVAGPARLAHAVDVDAADDLLGAATPRRPGSARGPRCRRATRPSESLRTWRASPPSISGGYSQERIRTAGHEGSGSWLEQGAEAEVGRQVAHPRCRAPAARVYGLEQRPRMADGALAGVVARLAAVVEERPVARLHARAARARRARRAARRQAGRERPRSSRSSSLRAAQARSATARRVPGAQVLALAPGRALAAAAPRPRGARAPRPSVTSSTPCSAAAREHLLEPGRPLPPPVAEQLGVDREDDQPAAAALGGDSAPSRSATAAANSRACSRGARRRGLGVVRLAADRPRAAAAQRLAMEVGVAGIGGVAVERPQPRIASQSIGKATGPAAAAIGRSAASGRLVRALVGAEVARCPRSAEQPLEPGLVGALRQPEAARLAEAPPVRARARRRAAAAAPCAGREQRQHRVRGRRGRSARPGPRRRRPRTARAGRRRAARAARAPRGSGPPRRGMRRRSAGVDVGGVALGRSRPGSRARTPQPLADPGRLELVGEHRRDGHRQIASATSSTGR